jgi:hypothetical protein
MVFNQNWDLYGFAPLDIYRIPLPAAVSVNPTTEILQVTIENLVQGKCLLLDEFKYKISLEYIR